MKSWNTLFLEMAQLVSTKSEDTKTQHGAIIVGKRNQVLSIGYNGLPRGVKPTPEKFERPAKYLYFEHSERNAIYNAVLSGVQLEGSRIYVTGYPCADCARAIIQSGMTNVLICDDEKHADFNLRWKEEIDVALLMFSEAGVEFEKFKWGGMQIGKAASLKTK